jgi:hypothetical protein
MRWPLAATVAFAILAPALGAQVNVTPGASRADVIAQLGEPVAERTAGDFTLLFYQSGCAPTCAVNDVVVLQGDRVVDALFSTIPRAYAQDTASAEGLAPYTDLGATTPRAVEPLAFHIDPTLHAARPLVARPYRLPGSFAPGDVAAFERLRSGQQ